MCEHRQSFASRFLPCALLPSLSNRSRTSSHHRPTASRTSSASFPPPPTPSQTIPTTSARSSDRGSVAEKRTSSSWTRYRGKRAIGTDGSRDPNRRRVPCEVRDASCSLARRERARAGEMERRSGSSRDRACRSWASVRRPVSEACSIQGAGGQQGSGET